MVSSNRVRFLVFLGVISKKHPAKKSVPFCDFCAFLWLTSLLLVVTRRYLVKDSGDFRWYGNRV